MHRFETPSEPRLRIRNTSGLVTVEAVETAETTIELSALRDDETTRNAIEKATVEAHGGEVTVEIPKQGWGFLGRSPEVAVRVRCPLGSALDCTTASADVRATGRVGATEVKTASGDVSLEDVAGELSVHTASGDVRASTVDGEARLNTVSGDVRLGTARADVVANTVSGDFELRDAHGSVSGNTVSGDQELETVRGGQIKLQSVSGDLQVGVAAGTRLFVDANSTSGDLSSELPLQGEPTGEGGAETTLRLKTVSGDVSIVRSTRSVEVA